MKERITDAVGAFTGGLNLVANEDTLGANEVLLAQNARVELDGRITRREGSAKLHVAALGAANPVLGVFYWEPDGSLGQVVAVANNRLYFSDDAAFATFTEVASPVLFASPLPVSFATFRDGANLNLYIAANGTVYKWDGSTLTRIDGTNNVPNATVVAAFGNRLFMNSTINPKTLYWSRIGTGDDFTTGGLAGGGFAQVDTLSNESIIGLQPLGSSLLIATETSIARFSGVGEDIQISQDSFGVSSEFGPTVGRLPAAIAPAFKAIGAAVAFWSGEKPYVATQAGVVPLTDKINVGSVQDEKTIAHLKRRHEIWFAYRGSGDTVNQSTVLVYNTQRQAWSGPFHYAFGIKSLSSLLYFESDVIMAGCNDGFVRRLDDTTLGRDDDATQYTSLIRVPLKFPGVGPYVTKHLRHVFLQAVRGSTNGLTLTVQVIPDDGTPVAATLVSTTGTVDTPATLRYDVDAKGRRFVLEISCVDTAPLNEFPAVIGAIVHGSKMDRI